jgi:hypothetical protein
VETTVPPVEEAAQDKADRIARREAGAFNRLRKEYRELNRQYGYMQAQLEALRSGGQQPNGEAVPQQGRSPSGPDKSELNRSVIEKIEDEGAEYEAVIEKITAPNFPISDAMRDYLAVSKNAAQVARLLADEPKEAAKIFLLGERAADRAMEQLEARATAAKAAPRTTRALPPPRTVGGSSSVRADPAKMSMDEYAEWRLKRPS